MLYQLSKYADNNGLLARPGFEYKTAKAVIVLTHDGSLVQVEPGEREFYSCPRLSQGELISGGITRSHFLLDSMGVVTGIEDIYTDKHQAFIELHCIAAKKVPLLLPLAEFIANPTRCKELASELFSVKIKAIDNITFRLQGFEECLPDLIDWYDFWEEYRHTLSSPQSGAKMRCLLDGTLAVPVKVIGQKLKLTAAGGQSTGSTLISFGKDAFSSYGLEQSENAACSIKAAVILSGALNDLIRNAPRPLANVMMLHWMDHEILPEEDPLGCFNDLVSKTELFKAYTANKQLNRAILTGGRPDLEKNHYHILLISGAAGRAMIRGSFEGVLSGLFSSVGKWFDDLSIIREHGGEEADPPSLFAVMVRMMYYMPDISKSTFADMMSERLAPLVTQIWRSILQRAPLPQEAAHFALQYAKSELALSKSAESKAKKLQSTGNAMAKAVQSSRKGPLNLDRIACAILKAWYNRLVESGEVDGGVNIDIKLNTAFPAQSYHAGRLLAVLNMLQHLALGDDVTDISQRFYSTASVTPGVIIGYLLKGAQMHFNKLNRSLKMQSLGNWYKMQISMITAKLDISSLVQLDFTGQILFSLGYYHQLAVIYESK